jgi:hypothetical protein
MMKQKKYSLTEEKLTNVVIEVKLNTSKHYQNGIKSNRRITAA